MKEFFIDFGLDLFVLPAIMVAVGIFIYGIERVQQYSVIGGLVLGWIALTAFAAKLGKYA